MRRKPGMPRHLVRMQVVVKKKGCRSAGKARPAYEKPRRVSSGVSFLHSYRRRFIRSSIKPDTWFGIAPVNAGYRCGGGPVSRNRWPPHPLVWARARTHRRWSNFHRKPPSNSCNHAQFCIAFVRGSPAVCQPGLHQALIAGDPKDRAVERNRDSNTIEQRYVTTTGKLDACLAPASTPKNENLRAMELQGFLCRSCGAICVFRLFALPDSPIFKAGKPLS